MNVSTVAGSDGKPICNVNVNKGATKVPDKTQYMNNIDRRGHNSSSNGDGNTFENRDSILAGYVSQMFKDSKFNGQLKQSIDMTSRLYETGLNQYCLKEEEKADDIFRTPRWNCSFALCGPHSCGFFTQHKNGNYGDRIQH